MAEINLLNTYPKTKRNIEERAQATDEDIRLSKQFGKEYFDGTRNQGYGGYKYDGRWVAVAKRFQEHYGLTAESRVLDIGCAKGFLLHDFRQVIPGITVAGIDISQYAIDNVIEDVRPFVQVGNARSLPYPDKSFDLVIAINTIHNLKLPDVKTALREVQRVSRGNAFVVLDSYRTPEEKETFLKWVLTAETHMYTQEWQALFKEVGYTGDYYWFIA